MLPSVTRSILKKLLSTFSLVSAPYIVNFPISRFTIFYLLSIFTFIYFLVIVLLVLYYIVSPISLLKAKHLDTQVKSTSTTTTRVFSAFKMAARRRPACKQQVTCFQK